MAERPQGLEPPDAFGSEDPTPVQIRTIPTQEALRNSERCPRCQRLLTRVFDGARPNDRDDAERLFPRSCVAGQSGGWAWCPATYVWLPAGVERRVSRTKRVERERRTSKRFAAIARLLRWIRFRWLTK